jgi:hypothetical protein
MTAQAKAWAGPFVREGSAGPVADVRSADTGGEQSWGEAGEAADES